MNGEKIAKEYQCTIGDAQFLFMISSLSTISPDNEDMISHSHLHEEIICVINGNMEIYTDESNVLLNSGDIAFINSNFIHNTVYRELTHYISIGYIINKVKSNENNSCYDSFLKLNKNKITKVENLDKFRCFDRINFYLRSGYADSDRLIVSCLTELIFLIKNSLTEENNKMQIPAQSSFTEYQYSYIDQYFSLNYNKKPSITDLSEQTFISVQQLQRIIKKLYRQNFTERILFLKIENAKRLLKSKELSIEEISHSVGYESSKSFYKAFKKAVGITPKQYRKSQAFA